MNGVDVENSGAARYSGYGFVLQCFKEFWLRYGELLRLHSEGMRRCGSFPSPPLPSCST